MESFAVNEGTDEEEGFQAKRTLTFDIGDLQPSQNGDLQPSQNGDLQPSQNDEASLKKGDDDPGVTVVNEQSQEERRNSLSNHSYGGEVQESVVQIITSHVEDLDVNSEYMYNNWDTGSGHDDGGKSHDGNESETRTHDMSLEDELEISANNHRAEEDVQSQVTNTSELAGVKDSDTSVDIERQVETQEEAEKQNEPPQLTKMADDLLPPKEHSKTPDKGERKSRQFVDSLIKSANAYVMEHKYKRAMRKYEEALVTAAELKDAFLIQSCMCNVGAILITLGQAGRAVEILRKLLESNDAEKTAENGEDAVADIQYNLGLAYDANGDIGSAVKSFQCAIDLFEKQKDDKGRADSFNQIADLLVRKGDPEQARVCYNRAAQFYAKDGNGLMKARMLVKEARMLNAEADRGKFLEVISTCEAASTAVLRDQQSNGNCTKEAKLFHDMAVLCRKRGNNAEALNWLEESWKRCQQCGGKKPSREDLKLRGAVAQSLARMYLHSCELMKAISVYNEAISLHGTLGNQSERGWCFYYLGEAYRRLCDYPSAERYYHVAHQTISESGDRDELWKVTEGLADINVARNHLDMAAMYYREALSVRAPSRSRTKSASEKIIIKLTKVLEDQKERHFDMLAARRKRVPIVVGYDPLSEYTLLDGNTQYSTQEVFKTANGHHPVTSTPHAASSRPKGKTRMRSARKRKGKRDGDGASLNPVTRGVGAYDSESDLSLVAGVVGVHQAYAEDMKYTSSRGRSHLEVHKSHYRSQLSVTPPGTSSDSDDKDDDDESSDSGCKNVWQRAKEMISRLGSDDTESSSSEEDEPHVRSGDRATGRYTSTNDEDEGIQSKGSDKFDHTYEHPEDLIPEALYSSVQKKGPLQNFYSDEPIYESMRGTKSLASSMPTRLPPPPAPPLKSHPSLSKKKYYSVNQPSTSQDYDDDDEDDDDSDDSLTSVTDDELSEMRDNFNAAEVPRSDFPTTNRMSRGGLEAGLYEIQKREDERRVLRQSNEPSSPAHSTPSKGKESSSRVCAVM